MNKKFFYFLFLILPFQFALSPFPGVDLAIFRILIILLFFSYLAISLYNKNFFIPASLHALAFYSFLFISILSLFWSLNPHWGIRKILFFLSLAPVFFIGSTLNSPKQHFKILKYITFGSVLLSIVGIFQFFIQFIIGIPSLYNFWGHRIAPFFLGNTFADTVMTYPSWLVNVSGHTLMRTVSIFPDPHMLSFYLGMTTPIAFFLYFQSRKKIYLISMIIIAATNLLTFSRGGYIAFLGTLIIFTWIFRKKILSTSPFLISFLLTIFLIFLIGFNPLAKRFLSSFNLLEGSNQERIQNWLQATEIISNKPLTGTGIGNYSLYINPNSTYRTPIYAHNLYLDITAEMGIFSVFFWLIMIVFSAASLIQLTKNKVMYWGPFFALIIFSIHSFFDTSLYSIHVFPLLLAIISITNTKSNS